MCAKTKSGNLCLRMLKMNGRPLRFPLNDPKAKTDGLRFESLKFAFLFWKSKINEKLFRIKTN